MAREATVEAADIACLNPSALHPSHLERALAELAAVRSTDDLTASLTALSRSLGFEYFSYLAAGPGQAGDRTVQPTILTSYPRDWYDRYLSLRYHTIDPVVTDGRGQRLPFFWGGIDFVQRLDSAPRQLFDEARGFGIVHGVTFPIYGPRRDWGLFSLSIHGAAADRDGLLAESYYLLQILTPHIHATAMERCLGTSEPWQIELTERERSCLGWTLQGKTAWEISRIIGRSKPTVDYHLQKAVRKLGAANKLHAAAKALELGLI